MNDLISSHKTTFRLRAVLLNAGMENASLDVVRAKGRRWWFMMPNCGVVTVRELGELVGGWPSEVDAQAQREIDRDLRAAEHKRAWEEIRQRRKQWQLRQAEAARQRQKDEQHETNASALHCLIEAFIEMRPYLPEEPERPEGFYPC